MMENYTKGKSVEEELERDKVPFNGLPTNFLWMKVKNGSKKGNLLSHASGIFEDKAATHIVWSGSGEAIPKTISCAEILKRQFSIEHQVTKLNYKKIEEYWEPKLDGLETIVVKREIPVIHILLAVDGLDTSQIGYQSIQGKKFWQREQQSSNKNRHYRQKRPFKVCANK